MTEGTAVERQTLARLRRALGDVGYSEELLRDDYEYADVAGPVYTPRRVPLAAFALDPPDYRNACIGAVFGAGQFGAVVTQQRALGAPIFFEILGTTVQLWSLPSRGDAELRERSPADEVEHWIESLQDRLRPRDILAVKVGQRPPASLQLDLIDTGLLPALEGLVQDKLDGLLHNTLAEIVSAQKDVGEALGEAELFRLLFRFLAAKVLRDRGREGGWQSDDPVVALAAIEDHYGSGAHHLPPMGEIATEVLQAGWRAFLSGLHFQNLSVDDLAFIYENTFVTAATRQKFGTHSTPPRIAEYIVQKLPFEKLDLITCRILELCSGHGIFLVSSMRRLRELLPAGFESKARHEYFRQRLIGIEEDPFACEVCLLHLMLADYPNPNGWQVHQENVFESPALREELPRASVVLCNPPFRPLKDAERARYRADHYHFPAELLQRVLRQAPQLLGFVLPRAFLDGSDYQVLHQQLAQMYGQVDLLALPDNVFNHAYHETVVVTAHGKPGPGGLTSISSATLSASQYRRFRRGLFAPPPATVTVENKGSSDAINLWVPHSQPLWEHLKDYPLLQSIADVRRGIEWHSHAPPRERASNELSPGWWPGYSTSEDKLWQYELAPPGSINLDPRYIKSGNLDWAAPKVLVNANAKSRRPWRLFAITDRARLVVTQSFHVLFPRTSDVLPEVITAIINGPVANVFVFEREGKLHNKAITCRKIPVPPLAWIDQDAVAARVRELEHLLTRSDSPRGRALRLVNEIDGLIIQAYNLPPAVRTRLEQVFADEPRPVAVSPSRTDQLPLRTDEDSAPAEWAALNERRILLVHRKHTCGVTEQELSELEQLTSSLRAYRKRLFPSPLAELRQPLPDED